MMVTQQIVLQAIRELTEDRKDFHTRELAEALSNHLGVTIKTDVARYWANQLVLKKFLERRDISPRLHTYRIKEDEDLPSSVTVRSIITSSSA